MTNYLKLVLIEFFDAKIKNKLKEKTIRVVLMLEVYVIFNYFLWATRIRT